MRDFKKKRGEKAKHSFPLSFITFLEGIMSAFLYHTFTLISLLV